MSYNAIACSGQMVYYQNQIFNDNKHIQDITVKMDYYSAMEDHITESLENSKSIWEELSQNTRNASNTLLEISVNDASTALNNAKEFLAQLKENGASDTEIQKAQKNVQDAEDNYKNKSQQLADAKNNVESLIQASNALTNQYFTKQKETQLKQTQALEKKLSLDKDKWEKRLSMHESELKGFQDGFKNSVKEEFTPNFAKFA